MSDSVRDNQVAADPERHNGADTASQEPAGNNGRQKRRWQKLKMGRGRKDHSSRNTSMVRSADLNGDRTEMVEAVRAISGAVAALADTLNALGLRIALEKTAHDSSDDHYSAYYHRLALLAESAAGQLGGIQKLLSVIELITVRSEPEQIKTPSGL